MTPEERKAMRERCDAATEGPWVEASTEFDDWFEVHCNYDCVRPIVVGLDGEWASNGRVSEAVATFIAHARTDLPTCLDALDEAETVNGCLWATIHQRDERVAKLEGELKEKWNSWRAEIT